jgi:hypothetical protein
MDEQPRPSIPELFANTARMEAAVRRAVRAAVLAHARAGNPVAFSKDGKVVWVQPAEILARFAAQESGNPTPES